MKFLDKSSLAGTLDALSEALFFQKPIAAAQRAAAAKWIARRQGLPGAYAGMFAATPEDMRGIRLFTGEAIRTRAGITHVLGEEACRVLHLLGVHLPEVEAALGRAIAGIAQRIAESESAAYPVGFYCCSTCTVAYWRLLATGRLPQAEERLSRGLALLKTMRAGEGQWRRFPFYYTSLALAEIAPALGREELRYAALRWSRLLKRAPRNQNPWQTRRAALGQRIIEKCV